VGGSRWGPRPLDLDIIFYGAQVVKHESLNVPHIRYASNQAQGCSDGKVVPTAAQQRTVLLEGAVLTFTTRDILRELRPSSLPPAEPASSAAAWCLHDNSPTLAATQGLVPLRLCIAVISICSDTHACAHTNMSPCVCCAAVGSSVRL
jgi:hypothetical protein